MRALHRRGPQKGAPAEAERRAAANDQRRRTARRALQHRVRDRAAVAEGTDTSGKLRSRVRPAQRMYYLDAVTSVRYSNSVLAKREESPEAARAAE